MRFSNKRLFAVLYLLIFALLINNTTVQAKDKNVIKTFKDKGKISKLCNEFCDLMGYYSCYSLETNQSKIFVFSKKKHRKEFVKFSYKKHGSLNGSEQNRFSKQIFGKGVTKVEQVEGDWGASWPLIKVSEIYKVSGKKFKLEVGVYMESEDGERQKVGIASLNVVKNSKGKYGYFVKKLKIRKL